jgi:hypothetical protein
MRQIHFALIASALFLYTATAIADPHQPSLICNAGPVKKDFGGTPWLVYGCDDQNTLVVVSAPGSAAAPFYFTLSKKGESYGVRGEGTGSHVASDAAHKELLSLPPNSIAELLMQTQKLKRP